MSNRLSIREGQIINHIIRTLIDILDPREIILFGSRSKGTNRHGSDFDIAVSGKKPSVEILREIDEKIEDVSGLYKVDIVFLETLPDELREIIYSTGKRIYGKGTGVLYQKS